MYEWTILFWRHVSKLYILENITLFLFRPENPSYVGTFLAVGFFVKQSFL
jgi:hypothetical protein